MTGHFHGVENVFLHSHPAGNGSHGQARAPHEEKGPFPSGSYPLTLNVFKGQFLAWYQDKGCAPKAPREHSSPLPRPSWQPLDPWPQWMGGFPSPGGWALHGFLFCSPCFMQSFYSKEELTRWDRGGLLSVIIVFETQIANTKGRTYPFLVTGIPKEAGRGQKFKGLVSQNAWEGSWTF